MRQIDARMIMGLIEQSPEFRAWVEEKIAELLARETPPPVNLEELYTRLTALELRRPPAEFDPSDILARLAALEARPIAVQVEAPAPVVETRVLDPLDPASWDSLEVALAALAVLITQRAAALVGHDVTLYERMVYLDALGAGRNADQDVELMQHHGWAQARAAVELARQRHLSAIRKLETLEMALLYDWKSGWPQEA